MAGRVTIVVRKSAFLYSVLTVAAEGGQTIEVIAFGFDRDEVFRVAHRLREERGDCDLVDETAVPHFRIQKIKRDEG
jgi:hypothetical protein